jgi:hexosaminidase
MKSIILTALSCFCITLLNGQPRADFNVVPLPNAITQVANVPDINLASIECICFGNYGTNNEAMKRNARFLAQYINEAIGEQLPQQIDVSRSIPHIELALNTKKITNPEGYAISVGKKVIRIEGATPQGVFYGIQVFRKALPVTEGKDVVIPAVQVSGQPRFAYRGMHLDVCRHFFGVDFVKEYIDIMALHGLNTLHWHISDDQGWRFEVEGYPKLIEVAAFREGSVIGRNTGLYDHQRHGGYFTREQIREIINYAAERYITIIPEVDMPGHMVAALAAYPELGCTCGPYEVEQNWGVFDDVFCIGKEETFTFVFAVLDEIMKLFPSEYIQIGGDEAPRTRWKDCPRCQQRIADEHITSDGKHSAEDYLQSYFTKRVEKYLADHGRKIIGWDELLEGDVNPSATIMSWRSRKGDDDVRSAAEKGHDIIMVPNAILYFDFYQFPEDEWYKPLLIGGESTLEKVYNYEPAPASFSDVARSHIIGVQANLWTEYIAYKELAEYQVLPRMAALAELQWLQPERKNYSQFLDRAQRLTALYDRYNWKYCEYAWKKKTD